MDHAHHGHNHDALSRHATGADALLTPPAPHDPREQNAPKLNRRTALQVGTAGIAALSALSLARKAKAQVTCTPTLAQTQGPFWVDEMLNRSDIRSEPTTGVLQVGFPLRLAMTVSETQGGACMPVQGAWVDIWHCNAFGAYSDANGAGNPNTLGQKWLRGFQVTDSHGVARFLTIYPGAYTGRTVHIHFRVRKFTGTTTTFNFASQVFFNDPITNAIYTRTAPYNTRPARNPANNTLDGIYNASLLLRMADNGDHAVASFNAVINANPGIMSGGDEGGKGNGKSLDPRLTPTDEDSMEHLHDFGGGTPPLEPLF